MRPGAEGPFHFRRAANLRLSASLSPPSPSPTQMCNCTRGLYLVRNIAPGNVYRVFAQRVQPGRVYRQTIVTEVLNLGYRGRYRGLGSKGEGSTKLNVFEMYLNRKYRIRFFLVEFSSIRLL